MGVVEHISDRVAVMYLGKVVELSERLEMFRAPEHPYTQALMSAIPVRNPDIRRKRIILRGELAVVYSAVLIFFFLKKKKKS